MGIVCARQTARHRCASRNLSHPFSSLPSSVTSLKLCDFLLLLLSPKSILEGGRSPLVKSCGGKSLLGKTRSGTLSAESLFACLINQFNFSAAAPQSPLGSTSPPPSASFDLVECCCVMYLHPPCEAASSLPSCTEINDFNVKTSLCAT